ncbi:MAG TPA: hypothetical protein VK918_03475 [Pyrinomonadaceae bacterium]|nr:hypothetical protein [Pyrinomonadaceae bacterium]
MLTKIYLALWVLLVVAFAGVYIIGNMTAEALVVFGFVAFGMVFMGMISVLPTAVHDSLIKH